MGAPKDFRKFCNLFYQEGRAEFSTDLEWIAATLGYVSDPRKQAVK